MAEHTSIEWCKHTQNWWIGCTEVSAACDNCYARTMSERYGWAQWGNHPRKRTSDENWRKPLAWNRAAEKSGIRAGVFTNSLSDFCDNQIDPAWRADAWGIIRQCTSLDWLILTKRPQNIRPMLPKDWQDNGPWPHVWLGTTVENQAEADRRIPHLLRVPAAVRFLSCEPLLEAINLDPWLLPAPRLDWIIVGGESGPKARPYHYEWAESIIHQCAAAGVPCFHKQLGAHPIGFNNRRVHLRDKKGGDPGTWPAALRVRERPGEKLQQDDANV